MCCMVSVTFIAVSLKQNQNVSETRYDAFTYWIREKPTKLLGFHYHYGTSPNGNASSHLGRPFPGIRTVPDNTPGKCKWDLRSSLEKYT